MRGSDHCRFNLLDGKILNGYGYNVCCERFFNEIHAFLQDGVMNQRIGCPAALLRGTSPATEYFFKRSCPGFKLLVLTLFFRVNNRVGEVF